MYIRLSATMSTSRIPWIIITLTGLLTVQGTPPMADPGPRPNPLTFPQGITLPDGITPDNFAKYLDESGRSLPNLPGDDVCGNQDFLSNMLVYQYLSGSISDNANTIAPVNTPTFAAETKTTTSLSTSLTTLVKTLEASTHFSTSTTSYVTTITSVITTVVPVIFRGSKVTTTLTNSNTEVITATEFFTASSVVTSSIVQTLPVEITISITSTKGFNGDFTIADLSRGASKVINEPITTSTVDFGSTSGIDISNLNLGGIDLTSLTSLINSPASSTNEEADLIAQLTALLGGEGKVTVSGPRDQDYVDTGFRYQDDTGRGNNFNKYRQSKFQTNSSPNPREPFSQHFQAPRSHLQSADETPFNVLPGFTLQDKPPKPPRDTKSGSATQNTRFSKFHKRTSPSDNKKKDRDPPADRAGGRFSASQRRPAFSRAEALRSKSTRSSRKVADNSRFQPAPEENFSRFRQNQNVQQRQRPPAPEENFSRFRQNKNFQQRQRPQAQSSLFRSGILKPRRPTSNSPIIPARQIFRNPAPIRVASPRRPASPIRPAAPKIPAPPQRPITPKPNINIPQITPGKTTKIFTMYLSGTNGETITTLRTVTLRNLKTRYRREASEVHDTSEIIEATSTFQTPIETQKPSLNKAPSPKEVLAMLKKLDTKNVKQMLKSLQKWVTYYSDELLEPEEESVTHLRSSLEVSKSESDNTATVGLPFSSMAVQSISPSNMFCPVSSIVTETIYHTIVV